MNRDELIRFLETPVDIGMALDNDGEIDAAWRTLLADAALGAMLRRLPFEWELTFMKLDNHGRKWAVYNNDGNLVSWGKTPDEALRQALTAGGKDAEQMASTPPKPEHACGECDSWEYAAIPDSGGMPCQFTNLGGEFVYVYANSPACCNFRKRDDGKTTS